MKKDRTVLPLTAAFLILASVPALGNETSVVRTSAERDFAAYLPALPPHAPWLRLDARTKLPKGGFPIARAAQGFGQLALPFNSPTQLTIRHDADTAFEQRL